MKMPRKEGWTSRSLIHLQLQLRILPRQHIRLLPRVQVRLQRLPKQWWRPKWQKWLFSTWWLENKKKVQETIFSCAFERNYQICNNEKKILICKSVLDFLLLEFKYAFLDIFFPYSCHLENEIKHKTILFLILIYCVLYILSGGGNARRPNGRLVQV